MQLLRQFFTRPDGTRLSYLDSGGSASAILILHGLAGSATEFIPTAEALDGRRVVLLDQRGHGHSQSRPRDVSREAFVADVAALIDRLGSPVTLVGQSMGGHTAMLTAAAHPDAVNSLVLLEADASGASPEAPADLRNYFESWPPVFRSRPEALAFLGNDPLHQAWVADLQEVPGGFAPRFEARVMGEVMQGLVRPRWAEWEGITTRTLAVFGERGMFRQEQRAEFVRRGHSVQRVDLRLAGHDAHLDAFDEWVAALREFLD